MPSAITAVPVRAVDIEAVRGQRPPAPPGPDQGQVRPVDVYPGYRPRLPERDAAEPDVAEPDVAEPDVAEALYLRVACEGGVDGRYGPIDREAAFPIREGLADALIGEDALAGTTVWDKLTRLDRHARHGHVKMAISALDNALWDVRGKVFGVPVWRLLGGGDRRKLAAYASTLGTPHDPETVQRVAGELAAQGYAGQKWFLADGPATGWAGMIRNVELAERVRGALGPGAQIMFDAWMGWDLAYARSWAREVERLRPAWLEEPFGPAYDSLFVELGRSTTVPLAAGEHLYDRREVLHYLQQRAVSVLQVDPEWCGGVTDLVRMCALAETFGVPVIPHGHGLHAAVHVVASQSPATCPMVEYLFRLMPRRHHFELDPPAPRDGVFALPGRPGFGIELDDSKIESRAPWQP
jgi:L-alanine-DL-glutamate epimerase-like enolase superfamily enzyme